MGVGQARVCPITSPLLNLYELDHRRSQTDEATIGSCKIGRLLLQMVWFASTEADLTHTRWIAAACDSARIKSAHLSQRYYIFPDRLINVT